MSDPKTESLEAEISDAQVNHFQMQTPNHKWFREGRIPVLMGWKDVTELGVEGIILEA